MRFVALLRGVNVGKAKRVPMAGLRGLLEDLGFTGVATLLDSGNALFTARSATSAEIATGEALLGRAGRAATTRNWATVQRIGALL